MNVTTSQLATYDLAKEAILARRGTGADGLATNVAASFTAGLVAAAAARSCVPACCALPACVLPACSLFACRCLPPPLFSRCLSDRKSTRLNSSHSLPSRMPSSA